jgi:hypothetical protein
MMEESDSNIKITSDVLPWHSLVTYMVRKPAVHMLITATLGAVIYSNTFNVSFTFDDRENIVVNPVVRELRYFAEPSVAEEILSGNLFHVFRTRRIAYLTFALNYRVNGLDVAGYHIVNLAIHILNALLVYWLVALTFRTARFAPGACGGGRDAWLVAFFASLVFVTHPVQTQAVTYIVQRTASLVAFFYLLSLAMYINARLVQSRKKRGLLYALSLVSAVLAMKTKENAFTLPFMVALYDFMFLGGPGKRRLVYLVPFFFTILIIPLAMMGGISGGGMGELETAVVSIASSGRTGVSQGAYLLTQFRVLVTYMRLLFLPVNQNVDYDYPAYGTFFDAPVFASFLFLALFVGLAIYFLSRSRRRPWFRLVSFGAFWFFMTLSVESSVIPIADEIFEHRAYLPSVGAISAAVVAVFFIASSLSERWTRRAVMYLCLLATAVLALLTYTRNTLWQDEIRLWEDVVSKSPHKARAHLNLGLANEKSERYGEAIKEYREATRLDPGLAVAHNNLGVIYEKLGRYGDAEREYLTALRIRPGYALAHNNLGVVYEKLGRYDEAVREFKTAIGLKPHNEVFNRNLRHVYELIRYRNLKQKVQ